MENTLSLQTLLAIVLSPLVGSFLVGVFGTKLGGNILGKKAGHTLTILGVLVACVLSVQVLMAVSNGASYNGTVYEWMHMGDFSMEIGFMVDKLTAMMMVVVTFVSLMVHLYTIGYMKDDPGYNRFFSYISLFTFAMLMLVMSNNLLQLFFGWEAVGLVSYLLIGFWYTKPTATFANMKAFLVNRVGDFGFILGIGLIAAYTGSFNYNDIFAIVEQGGLSTIHLPGTDWMLITVICICLFIGAMGKSAQFPLHVWLPDSMEGPTPISALIHAATMVTAGIFMVSRMSPLFELSATALNFMLVIGSITALFMGLLGIVQTDIKRVVAYSTLSQLGYMTVALGVSAYSIAAFHLMTHAFFKALLFLGAGSVIIGMHHNQDMRYMGGLRKYMPITWITSLIGSLALIGTPFFSGFYSKDGIIMAVEAAHHAHYLPASGFAYFAVMAGVFITAFYTFRMYFLVFHGKERYDQNPHAHDHHDDHGHDDHGDGKPHESPWVVWLPLVLLAIPSIVVGYLTVGEFFSEEGFLSRAVFVDHIAHPAMTHLSEHFHGAAALGMHGFATLPFWLALAGVVAAAVMYWLKPGIATWFAKWLTPIRVVLEQKYFMDWLYQHVFARAGRYLGFTLWQVGDRGLIDGLVVNGSWKVVNLFSKVVRWVQSGYLYQYALMMILGVIGLLTYFVWRQGLLNWLG